MKTNVLLAAIGGAVANFLLGWLIYGYLLMGYYASHQLPYEGLMREPPIFWAIFVGGLAWSFLIAWLFDKMGTMTLMQGFMNGLIISFLMSLSYDLFYYAGMNLYDGMTVMIVDVVVGALFGGVVAAVIAWILGMRNKTVAATA